MRPAALHRDLAPLRPAGAVTAAFVYCEFNGYTITSGDPGDEITLAEAAAAGALDIEQTADILRNWAHPATRPTRQSPQPLMVE